MPLEFDSRHQLFRVAFVGRVELPDVIELLTSMIRHPDFRPGMPAIWDANNADLSGLKFADLQQVRAFQEQHAAARGRSRIALVSANDMAFGIGRMAGQVTDLPHLEINVFRDMVAAEQWALAGFQRS